ETPTLHVDLDTGMKHIDVVAVELLPGGEVTKGAKHLACSRYVLIPFSSGLRLNSAVSAGDADPDVLIPFSSGLRLNGNDPEVPGWRHRLDPLFIGSTAQPLQHCKG